MRLCLHQVQDYGCSLKLDDGNNVLEMQHRLLTIFLLLDGPQAREYQRALSTSVHLWEWMRSTGHPAWSIFANNASAFNEESGEICFSVLARELAGSGIRSDCDAVSRKFALIKSKIQISQDLNVDLCGDDFSSRDHCRVGRRSEEVQAATSFFKRMIRALSNKSHRHYGPDCGVLDQKDRRRQAARKTVAAEVIPALKLAVGDQLRKVSETVEESHRAYWVYPHRDIWPAAAPSLPVSDDDFSDGAGEAEKKTEKKTEKQSGEHEKESESRPRKRQRTGDSTAAGWIGRVVAVPAFCLGERWSIQAFGSKSARNAARLHGRLEKSTRRRHMDCRFFHDNEYVLQLTFHQVSKYLVPQDEENNVRDTPFAE